MTNRTRLMYLPGSSDHKPPKEDISIGRTRPLKRGDTCPVCDGSGRQFGVSLKCVACDGTGRYRWSGEGSSRNPTGSDALIASIVVVEDQARMLASHNYEEYCSICAEEDASPRPEALFWHFKYFSHQRNRERTHRRKKKTAGDLPE